MVPIQISLVVPMAEKKKDKRIRLNDLEIQEIKKALEYCEAHHDTWRSRYRTKPLEVPKVSWALARRFDDLVSGSHGRRRVERPRS